MNGASGHISIIDGDPAVRDSLEILASLNGDAVRCYPTGADFLSELDDTVRCVVCSADLPDTDGLAVFEQVQARRPVPFALLLSRADRRLSDLARRSGVKHVFRKPLVSQQVARFIRASMQEDEPS